jgi:hypothetical protein
MRVIPVVALGGQVEFLSPRPEAQQVEEGDDLLVGPGLG